MEKIIHRILEEALVEVIKIAVDSQLNLEASIPRIKEALFEKTTELLRVLIESSDRSLLEDRAGRQKEGLKVERRGDPRSVMTQIGEICYRRTYYRNEKAGTYSYPIDQVLGVEPYERVDVGLGKQLVGRSREESYQRATRECCEGKVSRQTVMNKIRRAVAVIEVPSETAAVPELHVDADEDHVALQGGGCRSRTIVPLVSVYEGVEEDGTRKRCRKVFHISDYGKDPDELWEDTLTRIEQRYDLDQTKVYLHGDGAGWIARGMEWLPNATFVLDRYHKNKYVHKLLAGCDTRRAALLRLDLDQALTDMDMDYFDNIVRMLLNEMPQRADKITEAASYLRNHMPAIAVQAADPASRNGGATEPHVSHVLSSRLSSRPMGWSQSTLRRFAPILANGPQVAFKQDKRTPLPSGMARKAVETTRRSALAAQASLSWNCTLPIDQLGKRTELYKALHDLSHRTLQ